MNRRDFFKRTGLGAGALFFAPALVAAAWQEEWEAEAAVKFATAYALEKGAIYADARIGRCDIEGKTREFDALQLMRSDLLGMRICTENGWRHLLIRDLGKKGIRENLDLALKGSPRIARETGYWISAHFDREKVLARQSSDPETEADLHAAFMRYAQRPHLIQDARNLLFCDLLLEQ